MNKKNPNPSSHESFIPNIRSPTRKLHQDLLLNGRLNMENIRNLMKDFNSIQTKSAFGSILQTFQAEKQKALTLARMNHFGQNKSDAGNSSKNNIDDLQPEAEVSLSNLPPEFIAQVLGQTFNSNESQVQNQNQQLGNDQGEQVVLEGKIKKEKIHPGYNDNNTVNQQIITQSQPPHVKPNQLEIIQNHMVSDLLQFNYLKESQKNLKIQLDIIEREENLNKEKLNLVKKEYEEKLVTLFEYINICEKVAQQNHQLQREQNEISQKKNKLEEDINQIEQQLKIVENTIEKKSISVNALPSVTIAPETNFNKEIPASSNFIQPNKDTEDDLIIIDDDDDQNSKKKRSDNKRKKDTSKEKHKSSKKEQECNKSEDNEEREKNKHKKQKMEVNEEKKICNSKERSKENEKEWKNDKNESSDSRRKDVIKEANPSFYGNQTLKQPNQINETDLYQPSTSGINYHHASNQNRFTKIHNYNFQNNNERKFNERSDRNSFQKETRKTFPNEEINSSNIKYKETIKEIRNLSTHDGKEKRNEEKSEDRRIINNRTRINEIFNVVDHITITRNKITKKKHVSCLLYHDKTLFVGLMLGFINKFVLVGNKFNFEYQYKSNGFGVTGLCYSQKLSSLYCGYKNGDLKVFQRNQSEIKFSFKVLISCLEIGKSVLFIGFNDGRFAKFGIISNEVLLDCKCYNKPITALRIIDDLAEDARIAVADTSTVTIRDASNGHLLHYLTIVNATINICDIRLYNNHVIVSSNYINDNQKCKVQIFDEMNRQEIYNHDYNYHLVATHIHNNIFYLLSETKSLRQVISFSVNHDDLSLNWISYLDFIPFSSTHTEYGIVIGSRDGRVCLIEPTSDAIQCKYHGCFRKFAREADIIKHFQIDHVKPFINNILTKGDDFICKWIHCKKTIKPYNVEIVSHLKNHLKDE